ncbi:hypothetical protein ON010_g16866 [Phytophthora cinnamomi]|nr:hypothetical protein ON010_g16866 [Phytophthora cinnamomi]
MHDVGRGCGRSNAGLRLLGPQRAVLSAQVTVALVRGLLARLDEAALAAAVADAQAAVHHVLLAALRLADARLALLLGLRLRVLRYGKVKDELEPGSGEVKVQVTKTCIRWYAVSQIHYFQSVGARKDGKEAPLLAKHKELGEEAGSSLVGVVAEVNALLARLNVSLSTSYEELLAELLRLQHRAALAEEDRRAALKQVEQALREKRDAEKALVEELALWRAAKSCNAKKLLQLVSNESDDDVQALLNQPHPVKGTTPLMVAATKKYGAETIRALIQLDADLDAADTGKHRNTALHFAAYNNRIAQLELLLNAGANPRRPQL